MSSPAMVYRLKPAFEIPRKLDLPTCIYKMKSPVACVIHSTEKKENETEILTGILDKQPLPELASLEARWDSIFQQLSQLKLQLVAIKESVTNVCKSSGCPEFDSLLLKNIKQLEGAVIKANPSKPPYSLLLIKHLYKSYMPIRFCSHVHSSVSSLPDSVKCFTETSTEPCNSELKLSLIWKNDILDCELVLNPIKQLPIRGEVNILRYLARSGLKLLQYPSNEILDTIQTDSVLDLCHRLLHVKAAKEKSSLFKNLNAKLGRSVYFGGDSINICDISVWSALKQIDANVSQDLSQSMTKWFKNMDVILSE